LFERLKQWFLNLAVTVFVIESWQELKKVTWPGRKEVVASSAVVVVVAVVFMAIIFTEDWLIRAGLKLLY
jgi:preprotein translocase SecE subunit